MILQNVILFTFGFLISCIGVMRVPRELFAGDYIPYDMFPELYSGLPLFSCNGKFVCASTLLQVKSQFSDYKSEQRYIDKTPLNTYLNIVKTLHPQSR